MTRDGIDLEPELRPVVNEFFSVYDSSASHDHLSFFVTLPRNEERAFNGLRRRLKGMGYLPILRRKGGEVLLDIIPAPPPKKPWIIINILLLIATIGTTILAGTVHWMSYNGVDMSADAFELARQFLSSTWGGLVFFSIPLLLILGAHELGHYFMSRHHKVDATLPYFIPSPFTFGTFGAFISVKEPIPTKKALLDIGLAGPVCGLIVAIPVTLIGLLLAEIDPASAAAADSDTAIQIGVPILFRALEAFVPGNAEYIHPTAFAGWVGMFVTAINLLPAGQLDGGHVARALLGDKAKILSIAIIVVLIALGLIFEWSWILFALIIVFLGISHPPPLNDVTRLDAKRVAAGIMAGVIFVACFVPNPMGYTEPVSSYDLRISGNATQEADQGCANVTFGFKIVNDGDTDATVEVNATALNWASSFLFKIEEGNWTAPPLKVRASSGHSVGMSMLVDLSHATPGTLPISLQTECAQIDKKRDAELFVRVKPASHGLLVFGNSTIQAEFSEKGVIFAFDVVNDGETDLDIEVNATTRNWASSFLMRTAGGEWAVPPLAVHAVTGESIRMELFVNLSDAEPGDRRVELHSECAQVDLEADALLAVHVRGFFAAFNASGNGTLDIRSMYPSTQTLLLSSDDAGDAWVLQDGTLALGTARIALDAGNATSLRLAPTAGTEASVVSLRSLETGEVQRVAIDWAWP